MFQKHSVFQKLLIKYLYVAILPFLAVTAVMCFLMCAEFKKNEVASAMYELNEYVSSVNFEKTLAVQKSDYITDNLELLDLLEQDYTDNYNLLATSNKINSYINIINNSAQDTITLYTANKNLFKCRFISHIDELASLQEIRNKLSMENYMYFADELLYDSQDKAYFAFYRNIVLDFETIACIKLYLPKLNTENFELSIRAGAPVNKRNIVSVALTDRYAVSANINTAKLKTQYFLCIVAFMILSVLFSLIIIGIATAINKKTTFRINTFIHNLLDDDLLKIDMQTKPQADDDFELKTIKSALHQLIVKIQKANEEKSKTELEKKSLTLNLLQSKIDPHLLYNSLAVVSHNAYKNKDIETFSLIQELVSYYRLVLAKGKELTTIEDELNLVRKFVKINEMSHAEAYNLTVEVAPELAEYKIVHLILQPFIENAIIHGLAGIRKKAMLKITCTMKDDFLQLTIYDNGYGIKPETLEMLQHLPTADQGYGIKNTYDRLKLYYGNAASITFRSRLGDFTEVTVLLPDGKF